MPRLFALGYRRDRKDDRDRDAMKTILRDAPPPPAAARNDDLVQVVNQGKLGSCTTNAAGQAVRASELLERVELAEAAWAEPEPFDQKKALTDAQATTPFWSRLWAYFFARELGGDDPNDDSGTELRLVIQAINKWGFPPESAWPYSDDNRPGAPFSRMPSSAAYREAYDQRDSAANEQKKLIAYARITSTGDQRIADIKTAIASRRLVAFGTGVTEAFCSDITGNNGRPIGRPTSSQPLAGGHAVCAVSYDDNGPEILNSWGKEYGGRGGLPPGCVKFDWDYMTWSRTSDLWVLRRVPLLPSAKAA